MNTTSLLKPAGLSLGLLFASLIASNAVATTTPVKPCAGAEVVTSTTMKPAMPNGKGPLVSVPGETKTVCHMCPVTTMVTKNSLPNGKGVSLTTEETKTGAEHNCAKCTGTPAKS